ncbi:MAG: hypothetical protein QXU47_07065 [Candidatus Bathyarchaeia archaeon]
MGIDREFKCSWRGRVSGYRLEERISVELILEDGKPVKAEAVATILPGEEVIISDNLTSNLGIVILDPHKGVVVS